MKNQNVNKTMTNMKMTNDNVKGLLSALTELSKADSNLLLEYGLL